MKKVISLLLCAMLTLSCASVSAFATTEVDTTSISAKEAIEKYEADTGKEIDTNRYYFLMPNGSNGEKGTTANGGHYAGEFAPSWYNDCGKTAGVYWWSSGVADPERFPGYTMEQGDSDCVYYADIPNQIETIIFNNYFNRGMDATSPDYYKTYQSHNIDLQNGYSYGDNNLYPYGLESFADMIFVVNPDMSGWAESNSNLFGGYWYYYYGNGCYGTSLYNDERNCVREDHDHDTPRYTVTGSPELLEYAWDPGYKNNRMEYDANTGSYTKTYVNVKAGKYQFCIVDGWWTGGDLQYDPDALEHKQQYPEVKKDGSTINITCDGKDVWYEILSPLSVAEAIEKYEADTGKKVETFRYYFLMPNGSNGLKGKKPELDSYGKYYPSWHNEYATSDPCVYWWDSGVADPDNACGYLMEKGDEDTIFYADVPVDVTTIRFNNNIDYTKHLDEDILYSAFESINIGCEYYDAGENENYPDGTDSFDEMIYVIDPSILTYGPIDQITAVGAGEWYYYYGGGCFGTAKGGNYSDCLRDDHTHTKAQDNCLYFDANTSKWENTEKIYCHIYDEDGNYFFEWQSKKEKCIDTNGDGVWTYDLKNAGIILDETKTYYVIFSNGLDGQSMSVKFSTLNLGQTAYCTGFYLDTDKEFKFPDLSFKETIAEKDGLIGDVDNDGAVTILDATTIQMHIASLLTLSDEQLKLADVDGDNNVTVLDATSIQITLAEL